MLEEVVSAVADAEQLTLRTACDDFDPESLDRFAARVGKLEESWRRATPEQFQRLRPVIAALRDAVASLVQAGEGWLRDAEPSLASGAKLQRLKQAYSLP